MKFLVERIGGSYITENEDEPRLFQASIFEDCDDSEDFDDK